MPQLGRPELMDPVVPERVDVVLMESTCADRNHRPIGYIRTAPTIGRPVIYQSPAFIEQIPAPKSGVHFVADWARAISTSSAGYAVVSAAQSRNEERKPCAVSWCGRFGQSGRMNIRPQLLRASTWIADGNGKPIEIHVIGCARGLATVWIGEAALLDRARQQFADRVGGLDGKFFLAVGILLQLLLGTLDAAILSLDAQTALTGPAFLAAHAAID